MYTMYNIYKKLFFLLISNICLTYTSISIDTHPSSHSSFDKKYQEPLMTRIEQRAYTTCMNVHNKLKTAQKKLAPYDTYAYKATMLMLPPVAYYTAAKAYLDYHGITDQSVGYFNHRRNEFIFHEPNPRSNHILNSKKAALPIIGLLAMCCWPQVFAKKQPQQPPKRT